MNNPYQVLAQLLADRTPAAKVPVGLAAFNNVDVAENIGHDKLKKKPYNPYDIIVGPEVQQVPMRRDNFRREMLRDAAE